MSVSSSVSDGVVVFSKPIDDVSPQLSKGTHGKCMYLLVMFTNRLSPYRASSIRNFTLRGKYDDLGGREFFPSQNSTHLAILLTV